jgi:2-polyprenyl-3-methyl-5-hydroxy-6-metoxy-1,4-benzoquinol methylase
MNYNYTFHNIKECNLCKSSVYKILGKRLNQSQGFNPKDKLGVTTTVVKCKGCGLVYSNPLPIPNDIQDHYGVPPESYWKEDYFKLDINYFSAELQDLSKLLDSNSNKKALDIGAGLGKCMIALNNYGLDAYGIEPSECFHKLGIDKMGISKDKLQLSTIETAHFEHESFEFITFGAVLEHLYDPILCVEKALSWLKPGGLIHIEVPNSEWLSNKIINFFYKIRGLDYVGNISPMHTPYHLYEFSLKSFNELAQVNGMFEVAYHKYYVCDTYLPKVFDPILKPLMKKTDTGMQLVVWLRKK